MAVGETFSGTYTYALDTADTAPETWIGGYFYGRFEVSANGCRLRIHGATGGGSDAEGGSPFFLVEVVNNDPQDGSDRLTFLGTHVVLDCGASFPTQFNSVSWTLIDPTGRALSSTALPTRAPKLNAWQTATLVMRVEFFGDLTVHAHVTEAKPD